MKLSILIGTGFIALLFSFTATAIQVESCLPSPLLQQYAHNINAATGMGKNRNIAILNARANLAKQLSSKVVSEFTIEQVETNNNLNNSASQKAVQTTWQKTNANIGSIEILALCSKQQKNKKTAETETLNTNTKVEVLIINAEPQKQQLYDILATLKGLTKSNLLQQSAQPLTLELATTKQEVVSGQVVDLKIDSNVAGFLSLFSCGFSYCYLITQQQIQSEEISLSMKFTLPNNKNQRVITTTEWLWATVTQTPLAPRLISQANLINQTSQEASNNYWHYWLSIFESQRIQANTAFTLSKYGS